MTRSEAEQARGLELVEKLCHHNDKKSEYQFINMGISAYQDIRSCIADILNARKSPR